MFLLNATGSEIMDSVRDFFALIFREFSALWFWPIILIGLMIVAFVVMLITIGTSYENKTLKSINKINTYFFSKPFITDENLVEFNLKMKKVPKALRNNWQIYMLNREDTPSTYINAQTCIDKPLRTSSIEKNMSNFGIFTVLLAIVSFVVGLQYTIEIGTTNGIANILFFAGLVPLGIVFLYSIFILIIKLIKNDIYSTLYDNFPLFERNLTKAVSTLPSYVDYEILFTKKEIREGIPILQQYLEKRALIEQQELEKARENSVACEEYNFDELGIDGSLVLERAMKECETFIKTRRRLQEECDEIETEKENYKKNFETTEKDFQRKLQASRENLESLRAQQEASTNRIESNYIKKQQADEIKKQQQLEKDSEEATAKFKEEQITLEQEIEKRKQEIDEKKSFVEQAMLLEFKHYANTLYKALAVRAAELGNQKVMNLAQENADLKGVLNDLQGMQVEAPTMQENLVQPEEVSGDNLYQMTNSDEQQLEAGREEMEEKAKEEDEKGEKRKKAKKAEQEANAEGMENAEGVNPENPEGVVNQENPEGVVSAENVDGNADANGVNVDGSVTGDVAGGVDTATDAGVVTGGDETAGGDTATGGDVASGEDGNADGGKEMNAQDLESANQEAQPSEDDIETLQKKIEEENANLQKQKEEFAKDLDKTISQMDGTQENVEAVEDSASKVEEPAKVEEPTVEEPKVEEPKAEAPARASRSSGSRTRRTGTRSSSSRGSRGGSRSRSSSGSSASKAASEIDALNAEMEKLLDSTKK